MFTFNCWQCVVPLACSVVMLAAPASAQNSTRVQVEVAAVVEVRCGFVGSGVSGGSFEAMSLGSTRTTDLSLDCNTPFSINVTSNNGGLVPTNVSAASLAMGRQEGFATKLDYSVSLSLPVRDIGTGGSARIVSAGCASATAMMASANTCELTSGSGLKVDAITDGQPGQLSISLPSPTLRPVAGTFADTISITIEPAQ